MTTMSKESILKAALEIGFYFRYPYPGTPGRRVLIVLEEELYAFASTIIANAESEHREALAAEREVRGMLETQGRFLLGSIAEIRAALDPSKLRVVREFRAALAAAQALDKKEG
jgi:hypothetical protein